MSTSSEVRPGPPRGADDAARARRIGIVGVAVLAVLLVAGLLWAKWLPYADRIGGLVDTRTWDGSAVFGSAGEPGSTPTVAGAWAFAVAYFAAVWRAAVVALVVAAALEALVPRRWLVGVLSRRTHLGQGAAAGLASMPTMMCSCCTAPVAIGLRQRGVPLGATLAYWIGNPLLNPAVLVFLALTLPWQLTVVRVVAAVLLVVVGSAVVARWLERRTTPAPPAPGWLARFGPRGPGDTEDAEDAVRWGQVPGRFARSLLRFAVVLVPEYVVTVLAIGLLSGWLSDFAGLASAGPLALLLVAVVGTALVVPTGGEVPVAVALVAAGAGSGVVGVLLVALPALSLPSAVMVARTLSWRATAALAGLVAATSLAAGGLLVAIT